MREHFSPSATSIVNTPILKKSRQVYLLFTAFALN